MCPEGFFIDRRIYLFVKWLSVLNKASSDQKYKRNTAQYYFSGQALTDSHIRVAP